MIFNLFLGLLYEIFYFERNYEYIYWRFKFVMTISFIGGPIGNFIGYLILGGTSAIIIGGFIGIYIAIIMINVLILNTKYYIFFS